MQYVTAPRCDTIEYQGSIEAKGGTSQKTPLCPGGLVEMILDSQSSEQGSIPCRGTRAVC
jgi:hypothetical protein